SRIKLSEVAGIAQGDIGSRRRRGSDVAPSNRRTLCRRRPLREAGANPSRGNSNLWSVSAALCNGAELGDGRACPPLASDPTAGRGGARGSARAGQRQPKRSARRSLEG